MAKSKSFYNAGIVAAKSVIFGSVAVAVGLLVVSCVTGPAISEAIKSAPSIDAVYGLKDKLLWIKSHAETGGEYVVRLDSDESTSNAGILTFKKKSEITNVTITIKSTGEDRTIAPAHFRVGSGVTLILDNNITLRGKYYDESAMSTNNSVVLVDKGGTLVMNEGSAIIGNTNNFGILGGGVHVSAGGAFYMNGGTISGNKCIAGKQLVTSTLMGEALGDALIGAAKNEIAYKGNKNAKAVGKFVGDILDSADAHKQYPASKGGGVYVSGLGAALFGKPDPPGIFVKTGGTITGYESDPENGNVVMAGGWPAQGKGSSITPYTVSGTGGHAVYFGGSGGAEHKTVNITLGPDDCFEFRDGIYREIQCAQPKQPEPEAVVMAEPTGINETEGEVDPELLAVLTGAPLPVQAADQVTARAPPEPAPIPQAPVPAPVQEAHAAVPAQQQLYGEPNIAAYVFGAKDPALNKAMAARLVIALTNSGRYQVSENYMEVFDMAAEEQRKSGSTQIDINLIKGLGERFGADYICVAEIVTVFGEYRTFAHLLSVKTAKSAAKGTSNLPLKTLEELTAASEQIAESMLKKETPPAAAVAPPVTPPVAPPQWTPPPPAPCIPSDEPAREEAVEFVSKRRSKTGFTLGYGFSGDASVMQLGGAHIYPITESIISLAFETNFRLGEWNSRFDTYYETISYYGVNIPVLCKFEKSAFFMEAGLSLDVLSAINERTSESVWMTNVGAVAGAGLTFGKGYTQYFYRFNYGTAYYSHVFGIRQLF
jgi:hypothetical protein